MISILKMETYVKLSKNGYINMVLVLLIIHIVNGAVVYSTSGNTYFGESFTVTFTISPSFTTSATVSQDSTFRSSCIPSVCGPSSDNNVTFTPSGTKITLIFNPVSSSQTGNWQCLVDTGELSIFPFNPTSAPSNNPCVGTDVAVAILCIFFGFPEGCRVIICIIMYCCCTQKITITVTADKNKKLISAKPKIKKKEKQPIPIENNTKCNIVAHGGESHEYVFQMSAYVLNLKFTITDDLLNVIPGQTIDLPTILRVDPKYSTIKWCHDGKAFENDSLCFTTRVTRSTYGVYNIKMKFEHCGLTILIRKMRVQGIYWMLIVISVPINVLCGVIGAAITGYYRSTDGFCISVISIIIPAVLCVIINGLLVAVLVYNLFKRRTGNETNSRSPKPVNDVTTPPTPSTASTVSPSVTTTTSTMSRTSPSAVDTTYSMSGTSPSAVITTYSTVQNRQNLEPPKKQDGGESNCLSIELKEVTKNVKENSEQTNLIDRKS